MNQEAGNECYGNQDVEVQWLTLMQLSCTKQFNPMYLCQMINENEEIQFHKSHKLFFH